MSSSTCLKRFGNLAPRPSWMQWRLGDQVRSVGRSVGRVRSPGRRSLSSGRPAAVRAAAPVRRVRAVRSARPRSVRAVRSGSVVCPCRSVVGSRFLVGAGSPCRGFGWRGAGLAGPPRSVAVRFSSRSRSARFVSRAPRSSRSVRRGLGWRGSFLAPARRSAAVRLTCRRFSLSGLVHSALGCYPSLLRPEREVERALVHFRPVLVHRHSLPLAPLAPI